VAAILSASGFDTTGMRQHAGVLRKDVGIMLDVARAAGAAEPASIVELAQNALATLESPPDAAAAPSVAMGDDVQAIRNLVYSYAELLDTGDIKGLAQLFAHATVRTHGSDHEMRGAEPVRALIEQAVRLYDGVPGTKHLVTNVAVEVDEDRGSATARSYYTALQARPELPLQPILAGRWHDRFERAADGWRFTDRVIYTDLVGDLSRHIKGLPE
jgi:3-phenylpropionate/cinnamic acid dioxygenase small subunit